MHDQADAYRVSPPYADPLSRQANRSERKEEMTRNLKALALALVAVFAISAVVASAASAADDFTAAEYGVHISGQDTEVGGSTLTAVGVAIACNTAEYTIADPEALEEPYFLQGPTTSLTMRPTYEECSGGERSVTIAMNGCDYKFHLVEETKVSTDLVCPEGKTADFTIYEAGKEHTEANEWCNFHIKGQTGLNGLAASNEGGKIRLKGTVEKISTTFTKRPCTANLHLTLNIKADIDTTFEGENEAGGTDAIMEGPVEVGDFTAAEYGVHISGADTAVGSSSLTFFGASIRCSQAEYTNTDPETAVSPYFQPAATSTLTIIPTYSECSAGERAVTITMNGCDYVLTTEAMGSKIKSDLT
ncbi:MAG: hypothetical protein WBM00_08695, partial [Solirubrobacterales bacterium]